MTSAADGSPPSRIGEDGGMGEQDDGPSRTDLARRILRFQQAVAARAATTTASLPMGVATLCPDLPEVHAGSAVEVTRPAAVSEVLRATDAVFGDAGLAFRRISTAVPEVAWTLGPALADRGFEAQRLVTAVHDGHTVPPVSPLGFAVVDHERFAPVSARISAGYPWGQDPAYLASRGRWDQRLAERVGARFAIAEDGSGGCHLYRHGRIAQIESVNVLPEARGQGIGLGLMAAAMAHHADAGILFLTAEADDWPLQWYRRLGFEPVSAGWEWVLDPST